MAAGLDALIRKMQQTFSLTSIVVTREMASVDQIADTVCMLQEGNIIAFGSPDTVRATDHPYVKQFFERRPDEGASRTSQYFSSLKERE